MSDKERLEDIKNARYFFHDVQDSDLLKDWNWLIEQAEKVQELQEENKRYREALKYYADSHGSKWNKPIWRKTKLIMSDK